MPVEAILVTMTAGSAEEARNIAGALLDARLVACANLVPNVESLYWWQGKREEAAEVLILAKTRAALFDELLEAVRAVHSYEVFECIASPISLANPEYLEWIETSTREPELR